MLLGPLGSPSLAVDKPDMVVTSVSDPPASALPGDSFALDVTVKNQGLGPANATSSLPQITTKFYLVVGNTKKNLKGVQTVDLPIAAGESREGHLALSVYSDTAPGTYTLQACADGDGDISEAVENNNCTSALGQIVVQQAPDLIISSISNPPSNGLQGGPITVKDTVKNVGPVDADPTLTKYYLVSVVDGSKIDLKLPSPPNPTPVLDPGDTYSEQQEATIRPETEPGQYFLQACADGAKTESEVDENNNCLTSSGKITVAAVPDLIVPSVTVTGALTVEPGDSLSISAVVTNQGEATAKSSTMKFILINTANGAQKNLNGTQSIPQLNANASTTVNKTVTVYSDTASGTYTVQACADSGKVVAETVEGNNCGDSTAIVTVQGITTTNADLLVTSVTPPPATALPGDAFTVTAVVQNQGTGDAPASTTSFYLVNTSTNAKKNLKGGQNVGPLAAGASEGPTSTITVYSDTAPGTYRMQACADGPKAVAETAEGNNCKDATGTLVLQQVPNLIVASIGNPPSSGALDGVINLKAGVKNTGNVQAGASDTKYYLVSIVDGSRQDLKGSQAVPALNPTQTFSITTALTIRDETAPGTYKAQACADGGKDVAETNEDDNCKTSSGTIHITGKPDLIVSAVSVKNAPLTVAPNGILTVTATFLNQGEGKAVASTGQYYLVNNTATPPTVKNLKNGTQAVGALNGGGGKATFTKTVTVFGDTPTGAYVLRACADPGEDIPEASETNNCKDTTAIITVQ